MVIFFELEKREME